MKKFLVVFVGVAALLTATTTTFAQSKDLSGSWVLDVEKSGKKEGPQAISITLTASEFIAKLGPETSPAVTFKLDGTETTMPKGGGKARAKWEGSKVAATIVLSDGSAETVRFSRDGAWLVMEGQSPEHGPMKLYFKKAATKL